MKRILIRSGKSPFHAATREEIIHQDLIGTNSGNLVFSDAAHKLLLTDRTEVTSNGLRTDPSAKRAAQINERYDVFVVPLANAFRLSFQASLDRLSNLIEQLTIPVVVLGVGAQATDAYDTSGLAPIEASVKRFAAAVLKRSPSIGVRGELTAEYLKGLGIKDIEVIGCPSMFLYGDTLPTPRKQETLTADSLVAINLSRGAVRRADLAAVARHAQARYPRLTYYAQNLVDAELLFWGDTSTASGERKAMPQSLSHPLLREKRTRVPMDASTWIDELRAFDFSYGTRIHGNIAALLAGTPAVVLGHDSRTIELCRYFEIPYRKLREFAVDTDPAELYEQADYSGMLSGHKERFERFTGFLGKHDLENTFDHGDGGAAFDARLAELDLPSSIEVWDGSDDGALGYRMAWLREQLQQARTDADRRVAALEKKLGAMERRLAAAEKRVSGGEKNTGNRIGRAVRRRVRRITSSGS